MKADTYLLLCYRYIALNPVRAAMVADPADYRWSRYRCNALGDPDRILTPHPLYCELGTDNSSRCTAYREVFREALDDVPRADLRLALNQDQPIGNDRFYREIEAVTSQKRELRKRGRPRKHNEEDSADAKRQTELPR